MFFFPILLEQKFVWGGGGGGEDFKLQNTDLYNVSLDSIICKMNM